jgi:hypothetical protein
MATWVWIVIAIAVLLAIALVAMMALRQRRTTTLRHRFGGEYDRTVQAREDRQAAEADLRDREKQRASFDIKPLPDPTRRRFAAEWEGVQEHFVDQPSSAVETADELLYRVMGARGYPMERFEKQANLISVDHPDVVENYRFAHGVRERARTHQATTEDLREALLHYRSLFDELLQPDDARDAGPAHDRPIGADEYQERGEVNDEGRKHSTRKGIR